MANYKGEIISKFKSNGYKVKVKYTHYSGEHPVYYVSVWNVDEYAWDIINEILDEYGLYQNDHYRENDYEVFDLFDPELNYD